MHSMTSIVLALVASGLTPLVSAQTAAAPRVATPSVASAPAASSASAAAAAALALKPGIWETTAATENIAATSRRSVVGRSCVVAADAANPQRIIPVQREPGMQCENRDVKREGSNWVWAISCKAADSVQTGSGKLSVASESYLGRAELELRKKGEKPVKLAQTFSGKWIQACP